WALNQQGTRALCLGNIDMGRELLSDALKRRIEMGDHAAASVTRRNLDWLLPPATSPNTTTDAGPEPQQPFKSTPAPARRSSRGLKLAGAILLAGLVAWFYWPVAKAEFTPRRLSFTGQEVNKSSAPTVATLINLQSEPLPINAVSIVGAAAGEFRIVENNCLNRSLAKGEQCGISVVFTPQAPGDRQATLRIFNDAANKVPELPLIGSAVLATPTSVISTPPSVTLTPSVAPSPSPSPSPTPSPSREPRVGVSQANVDFGEQQLRADNARLLRLTNTGDASLTISNVTIAGTHSGEFFANANTCQGRALAPNGSCEINVTFRPQSAGARTAA